MSWFKRMWRKYVLGRWAEECSSCWELMPLGECPKSLRRCGHHCNCSWSQDECDYCGEVFGVVE